VTVNAELSTLITADSTPAERSFDSLTASINKLIAVNEKLAGSAKKAGDAQKKAVDSQTSAINRFFSANRSLGDVAKNLVTAISKINPAAAIAVGGIAGIGAAAAVATRQAVALADEVGAASQRLGVSAEELSKFKFAAEQSNASFSDIQAGFRGLNRTAILAARGSTEAKEAFKRLGIDVNNANGTLKTTQQLFGEAADAISKIQSPAEKAAAAVSLFGRSAGPALVPLLNKGKEGIASLGKEAEELGIVISTKLARDTDDLGSNMRRVRAVATGFGVAIAETLVPALNDLLVKITPELIKALKDFRQNMGEAAFLTNKYANTAIQAGAAVDIFVRKLSFIGTPRHLFSQAELTRRQNENNEAIKRSEGILERAQKQASLTREEFDRLASVDFSDVKNQSDELEGAGGPLKTMTEVLKDLADRFKDLDKEAIAPIVAAAQSLAEDGFGLLNPKLDELIENLKTLATSSPVAAKALREVLDLQQEARDELKAGTVFSADPKEQNDALLRAIARRSQGQAAPGEIARPVRPGGVQGPETREGEEPTRFVQNVDAARESVVELDDNMSDLEERFFSARQASDEFFTSVVDLSATAFQSLDTFATGFADALTSGANIAKIRFGDFFKGLLRDLARAIVRALILKSILGFFGGSLGSLTKTIQAALGFGGLGFQDKESSILGRAAAARSAGISPASVALAPSPAAAGAGGGLEVRIMEPGPFTWAEVTDRKIGPRLHYRRDHLNERAF
jgi:hypothetical protein